MKNDTLTAFQQYQFNVCIEEYEFSKYTDLVIIDHQQRLLCFFIWLENNKGNKPSQKDIIYALGMAHSTVRKNIKHLIEIKYLQETTCNEDARFARYESTEILYEGMKVNVARHIKTLFFMCKQLIEREEIKGFFPVLEDALMNELGSYYQYETYGEFNKGQSDAIIKSMYAKEIPLNNSAK